MQSKTTNSNWLWKTKTHEWLDPKEMSTAHLYNTVKMIWNHSVEEKYRIVPYTKYVFGGTYTKQYMNNAIAIMVPILYSRTLTVEQRDVLEQMHCACNDMNIELKDVIDANSPCSFR